MSVNELEAYGGGLRQCSGMSPEVQGYAPLMADAMKDAALLCETAAAELDRAAAHCRTAATHFREGDTSRCGTCLGRVRTCSCCRDFARGTGEGARRELEPSLGTSGTPTWSHWPGPAMLLGLSSGQRWILEESVEVAGEVAFEAAGRFAAGLAFMESALDVVDRWGVRSLPGEEDEWRVRFSLRSPLRSRR